MTKKETGVIYELVAPNGRDYVGQTINYHNRMSQHKRDMKKKTRHTKLYCSLRKYGWEQFTKNVIYDNVPEEFLNIMEQITVQMRDTFHNGLNGTAGGRQGSGGWHQTEEAKKKISKSKATMATGKNTQRTGGIHPVSWKRKRTGEVIHKRCARIKYNHTNYTKCFDTDEEGWEWIREFKRVRGI